MKKFASILLSMLMATGAIAAASAETYTGTAQGIGEVSVTLTVEDGKPMLRYDYEAWQSAADEKGYHAIASSMEKTAEEMHQLYRLRDVSEKQFSILKSQLNGNTTRVHAEASIKSRLCAAFIASLLRTTAQLACESLDLDINVMLRKADGAC